MIALGSYRSSRRCTRAGAYSSGLTDGLIESSNKHLFAETPAFPVLLLTA
jgi:hypothetical protein